MWAVVEVECSAFGQALQRADAPATFHDGSAADRAAGGAEGGAVGGASLVVPGR
jgi:hypothetical protein